MLGLWQRSYNEYAGIVAEEWRSTRAGVGVAGGARKLEALRGTLRGNLISTLITDERTALMLLQ